MPNDENVYPDQPGWAEFLVREEYDREGDGPSGAIAWALGAMGLAILAVGYWLL
ncbi:MAG: hypothetical protein JWM36_3200 [Hyphomicrobiales bacterium]|nr:hypothetical protein [Hyphomicrobiales bacterium]